MTVARATVCFTHTAWTEKESAAVCFITQQHRRKLTHQHRQNIKQHQQNNIDGT